MNGSVTKQKNASMEEKQPQGRHVNEDWGTDGLLLFTAAGCSSFRCEKVVAHERVSDTCVRRPKQQEETFWKQMHLHHEALRATESMKGRLFLGSEINKFLKHFPFLCGELMKPPHSIS